METIQITPEIKLSVRQIKDAMKNLMPDEIFDTIIEAIDQNTMTREDILDCIYDGFGDDFADMDELQHYKDSSQGLYVTDIAPEHLFHKLMNFRSDANPFAEGGECQVGDGYKYIADMWDEFYKTIFFQLGDEPNERQIINIMDDMCSHSLDPDTFKKWEDVKSILFQNRKILKA